MTRLLAVLIVLAASVPAAAGPCATCDEVEEGLQRPGISYGDATADDVAEIEVADFYFAPRLAEVREGQPVAFTNTAPVGGSRHSVISADWGSSEPVLPAPVLSFGGGAGFRSERLAPGTSFFLTVEVDELDPETYVVLPGGDLLISYFCYIHGSSQMNGQLLVRR